MKKVLRSGDYLSLKRQGIVIGSNKYAWLDKLNIEEDDNTLMTSAIALNDDIKAKKLSNEVANLKVGVTQSQVDF